MKNLSLVTQCPFAHRGLHNSVLPENSLGSIESAVKMGLGVEIDVCVTADGQVIVFHDHGLQRLTGNSGLIKETDYQSLRNHRLLGTNFKIPTLAEVLALVADRVPLLIEIKSFDDQGFFGDRTLEAQCLQMVSPYQNILFKSFNPDSVVYLSANQSHWPVGLLACEFKSDSDFGFLPFETAKELSQLHCDAYLQSDFVSYGIQDLKDALSAKIRKDKPLMVWTVRSQALAKKAQQLADNIVFEGLEQLNWKTL